MHKVIRSLSSYSQHSLHFFNSYHIWVVVKQLNHSIPIIMVALRCFLSSNHEAVFSRRDFFCHELKLKLLKYSYDTVIPRIVRRLSVVRWLSYHAEAREQLNNSHNRPCACKAKHVHKIKQYCYKHNNISLEVSIVRLGARGERYARHELNNIRRLRHTHLSRYRVSVRPRLTPDLLKCTKTIY